MVLVIHTFILFSCKCKIPISIDNLSFISIILRANTGEIDRARSKFFLKFCKILDNYSTSIFLYKS